MSSAASFEALYLHIPFCRSRCAYCDFRSQAVGEDGDLARSYADALLRLVGECASEGVLDRVRTVYIGGGTPTALGEGLATLIEGVRDLLPHGLGELTFEANPESTTPELLRACREAGATRASIGAQSSDDAVLRRLGRIHSAREALRAIERASSAGLRVSADLIAGCPGQGPGDLAKDVRRIVGAGAAHVSVYALEVHEGTPFGDLEAEGRLDAPDEDGAADLLEEASRALEEEGLSRYEVSNYARPGEESRHNLAYWEGRAYLGLGPSAASMLEGEGGGRLRLACASTTEAVAGARSMRDLSFDIEELDRRQAMAEDLMLAARLSKGLSRELVERARAVLGPRVGGTLAYLGDAGLLEAKGDRLAPTDRGWLMGNVLYGNLWALAEVE